MNRWTKVLLWSIAALAIVVIGTLSVVHAVGPRFGIYLTAPSPQRYASIAVESLDSGYHATGPEWEAARERLLGAADSAESYEQLHGELAAATIAAGGKHSFLLTPADVEQWRTYAADTYQAPTVSIQDGITTITIPGLGEVSEDLQQQYALSAAEGIESAAPETAGWVIDLRGNTGGNMYPMLSGLAALLPNGTAMAFQPRADMATEVAIQDDGAGMGRTYISVGDRPKHTDAPIAVLQDQYTASSGEAVLTAFRGLNNARSFGTDSAGYSSANIAVPLYDDALIALTTAVYVDRDGVNLNEQPITPDQETTAEAADEAARTWLIEQLG